MKNFYYEILTGTLNLGFNPEDYLSNNEAIDELMANLNISVDETQELISKIEQIEKFQIDRIKQIEKFKEIDYVKCIFCIVTVSTISFASLYQFGFSPIFSFIGAMLIMSMTILGNSLVFKLISRQKQKAARLRGAFAECARNALLSKRQKTEFFTREDKTYTRADFEKLLRESQNLVMAKQI